MGWRGGDGAGPAEGPQPGRGYAGGAGRRGHAGRPRPVATGVAVLEGQQLVYSFQPLGMIVPCVFGQVLRFV